MKDISDEIRLSRYADENDLRSLFKKRESRTCKGDYGKVLCICGSYRDGGVCMSGAAALSAKAALRCGSGLVRVFTHKENYIPVSSFVPEAVMMLYGDTPDLCVLADEVKKSDAVLVGCGLGKSQAAKDILRTVIENISCPLVLDADALNIFADCPDLWEKISAEQRKKTVITPHMGEMSRLTKVGISDLLESTVEHAIEFAQNSGVTVLLKDNKSIITDGEQVYINESGNPGMATAGSGDVLAGILCSILGNSSLADFSFVKKVALGAYLHGLCGDAAKEKYGENSMLSRDICDALSDVLKAILHR